MKMKGERAGKGRWLSCLRSITPFLPGSIASAERGELAAEGPPHEGREVCLALARRAHSACRLGEVTGRTLALPFSTSSSLRGADWMSSPEGMRMTRLSGGDSRPQVSYIYTPYSTHIRTHTHACTHPYRVSFLPASCISFSLSLFDIDHESSQPYLISQSTSVE